MSKFVKVKSDVSLVRDMDSNAIVNQNQSEFDKFMSLSKKKYKEQNELAWAASFILVIMVLILNLLSRVIGKANSN